MTIDEIMHRLQVLKDGGYIWLHRNGGFYRYRNGEIQSSGMSCIEDPRLFLLHVDLERAIWATSSRSVATLVNHFQNLDVVFPPIQPPTPTPTRQVRAIEL